MSWSSSITFAVPWNQAPEQDGKEDEHRLSSNAVQAISVGFARFRRKYIDRVPSVCPCR